MSAVISPCGTYRYRLDREWEGGFHGNAVWVMLNPSTADADTDDRTISRCIDFSQAWGLASLTVVNVFALRSTDPKALAKHPDPVGPCNVEHVHIAIEDAAVVIAAWGQSRPRNYGLTVHRMGKLLAGTRKAHHLGLTVTGQPMHPLYRPADTPLMPWGRS